MKGITKSQKKRFLNVISNYYNLSQANLIVNLNLKFENKQPKNIRNIISQSLIKRYEKEENVNLKSYLIKTIRINKNDIPLESMSFSQIKYNEIINETWDKSSLHKAFKSEFIFFIFKEPNEINKNPVFHQVKFWKMNEADLELVSKFWELTKESIRIGNYKNFITIKNNFICHVRTKGLNNQDLMKTPQDTLEPKRGYWLNASYLRTQL
jgi:DNA mismatch repair protein MutH